MRRPMPEANSPAPRRAMPGTSNPVRGSCAVAVGLVAAGVGRAGGRGARDDGGACAGAVGVGDDGDDCDGDTGGWLESGGPLAWLLGELFLAELVVLVCDFFAEA